jgi:hypothetical protein
MKRQPRDLLGRTTEHHEHHEVRFHPQLVVRASSAANRPGQD